MNVKICGITNLEDAQMAAAAGAAYLGFIFYSPSKRAIDVKSAAKIVAALRQQPDCPLLVGVFVDETAEEMARVLTSVGLDLAQLSGDETPKLVGDPASPIYGRCYKALRPASYAEADADAEWYLPPANSNRNSVDSELFPRLLIDTYHPTLRGGTGETGDWTISAKLAAKIPGLMLAGGLNPGNVAEAVRQVRPFAVDVASGVEAAPGQKDPAAVRAFMQNAQEAVGY